MEDNWKEALASEKAGLEARLVALGDAEGDDAGKAELRANLERRIGEVGDAMKTKATRSPAKKEQRPG